MTFLGSSPTTAALARRAAECGVSLAGIASVARLRESPSYGVYKNDLYFESHGRLGWSPSTRSLLVLAIPHSVAQPHLDWWDSSEGGTAGNRALMRIARELAQWANEELELGARPLSYYVARGGVLLKDVAKLAGLGTIGRNNLLVTPEYGPRVRLRALTLDAELEPTGPVGFDPCAGCERPCWRACPQAAFGSGSYRRDPCTVQMKIDEANRALIEEWSEDGSQGSVVKYCRACELACPVGYEK